MNQKLFLLASTLCLFALHQPVLADSEASFQAGSQCSSGADSAATVTSSSAANTDTSSQSNRSSDTHSQNTATPYHSLFNPAAGAGGGGSLWGTPGSGEKPSSGVTSPTSSGSPVAGNAANGHEIKAAVRNYHWTSGGTEVATWVVRSQ